MEEEGQGPPPIALVRAAPLNGPLVAESQLRSANNNGADDNDCNGNHMLPLSRVSAGHRRPLVRDACTLSAAQLALAQRLRRRSLVCQIGPNEKSGAKGERKKNICLSACLFVVAVAAITAPLLLQMSFHCTRRREIQHNRNSICLIAQLYLESPSCHWRQPRAVAPAAADGPFELHCPMAWEQRGDKRPQTNGRGQF